MKVEKLQELELLQNFIEHYKQVSDSRQNKTRKFIWKTRVCWFETKIL